MKFVKKLLGKPEPVPTWDITPASDRPAPRAHKAEPEVETPVVAKSNDPFSQLSKDTENPWLDDVMLDTIQLEVDDLTDDDVYQTNSWEENFENDTRKLKTVAFGKKTEKNTAAEFNPYDTGSMRRSWKK